MKKITGVIALSLFTVLTVWSLGAKNPGDMPGTQAKWPEGSWQFSAHPYSGPDHQSRAVRVTSVGTTREDLKVSLVRVKNVSDKAVAAVKLGWRLYSEQDPDAILNSGETALIAISDGLPVGQGTVLKFSIVSFLELSQPLLKAGKLEGVFRMDVVATEVLYQDGTSWVPTKANHASLKNISISPRSLPPCPQQLCAVDSSGQFYTCQASGSQEYCTNCVTTCCNTLCSDPTPACNCN